jgi:hypothetical protein
MLDCTIAASVNLRSTAPRRRPVGDDNVAGPTLSSLGGEFGLQPLIGKPLAVVSDARFSGRDLAPSSNGC